MTGEVQLCGLPGPTHSFRGLAKGNVASQASQGRRSNPRGAARQSLALMAAMIARGIPAVVMPPQLRPHPAAFAALGHGVRSAREAADTLANLLGPQERVASALVSSAFMWTANAATCAASAESGKGVALLSPANLNAHLHRALEAGETQRLLTLIFGRAARVLPPLPASDTLADEGAANHMRLWPGGATRGLHVFVHGRAAADAEHIFTAVRPRQTREASAMIAARHGLPAEAVLHLRQNAEAVAAGSFHNDVIATSDHDLLLAHAQAFAGAGDAGQIAAQFAALHGRPLAAVIVTEAMLSLTDAVASYLFNSQIVTTARGRVMFAPEACRTHAGAAAVIADMLVGPDHVQEVVYADLSQSLANGGGPACLRLRVWLTPEEQARIDRRFVASEALLARLAAAVDATYPDDLGIGDFTDAATIAAAARAHAALAAAFGAPELYPALPGLA